MRIATDPDDAPAMTPEGATARLLDDLELVRRFEAGIGSDLAAYEELVRRVRRDRGWLVPGVAILLPGRDDTKTTIEHVSLRPRPRQGRRGEHRESLTALHERRSHGRQVPSPEGDGL